MPKPAGRVTKPARFSFAPQAKLKKGDYHDNMDGAMFERWLHTRLIPAFEEKYGSDMKMVLVMDNASYHHELNHEYFPKGKTPSNAPKGLCNDVLDKAGCRSIKVMRDGKELNFEITKAGEKPDKAKIPGTVHANFPRGPSVEELRHAMNEYLPVHCPQALDSRVEKLFREKKWDIIWTPPYCPKFQPIELVWGVGKQRAAGLYMPKRTMLQTREHLRRGWYGGLDSVGDRMEKCNVKGCWEKAMGEIDTWISHGNVVNPGYGVTGSLMELGNIQDWMLSGLEREIDESDESGEAADDSDDSDDDEEDEEQ